MSPVSPGAEGKLARLGLVSGEYAAQATDLLAQIESSGIETVRVVFTDQHGVLRGKTVVAEAMPSILASGLSVTSTLLLKDTSHRTVFPVWEAEAENSLGIIGAGDILLCPDLGSFRQLPWSRTSAWLFCTPVMPDGTAIPFAPQTVLALAEDRLLASGRKLMIGLELEFHVFRVTDTQDAHDAATMPGAPFETRNLAQGYQYLTELRYDALEAVMDDLRRTATALGIPVRSMEVEMGPSQFEFTFAPDSPMAQAQTMIAFRTMVKEVCARQGLHATFMCKPALPNCAASGWHIHQSIVDAKDGRNRMEPDTSGSLSPDASGWIAGLLDHAAASCLLTTPTVNGYKRYLPGQLAPDRIQWGWDNRGAMIRALMGTGDPASRVENRTPEPAANPYYAFASQILSGLDGIERGLTAPAPVESPYSTDNPRLPHTLADAIGAFSGSAFYRQTLGDVTVDYLCRLREAEWARYHQAISPWEQAEYFNMF